MFPNLLPTISRVKFQIFSLIQKLHNIQMVIPEEVDALRSLIVILLCRGLRTCGMIMISSRGSNGCNIILGTRVHVLEGDEMIMISWRGKVGSPRTSIMILGTWIHVVGEWRDAQCGCPKALHYHPVHMGPCTLSSYGKKLTHDKLLP